MGHGWLELVHSEDFEAVAQAEHEAIKGTPLKLEFRYLNKTTVPPVIRWVLAQDLPGIFLHRVQFNIMLLLPYPRY
jgi:hypothetical protein